MSKILILGGDGYLGWPTAMYFSKRNHEVIVVDNYFRRNACDDLDLKFLYPVPDVINRAKYCHEKTGYEIKVILGDLNDPEIIRNIFKGEIDFNWCINKSNKEPPHTVIHYAEQPSAPYSLIDYEKADFTITNNLRVTNNLMWAMRDFSRDTHLIKIGTMGEYGTPNIDIEEGWINISHKGREDKFLYPRQAGSIYHTSKIMDTDLLWFGVRMWELKVTDLMQGPVYGIETEECKDDKKLFTFFNYDEIFGTIINRFITQAVNGYPLTVFGEGGQTRGFLNIKDTLQCVFKSFETPSKKGELRIFNQIMETFSANEIADKVLLIGTQRGHNVKIEHIKNPRIEKESHYYNPAFQGLQNMGVEPHYLTDEVLHDLFKLVEYFKENINNDIFIKGIKW